MAISAQQKKEQDYLNQTFQGGAAGYIASQQERARQAQASGDTGLLSRLQADAQRIGFTIPAAPAAPQAPSAPAANEHKSYLDQAWDGGSAGYVAGQQERYKQAVAAGDKDLISRLQADSDRIGYVLPGLQKMAQQSNQKQPTQQIQQTYPTNSAPPTINVQAELQRLYQQERDAKLSAIRNRISGQVADTERQKIGLAPMFQSERSNADAQAIVAAKRLGELMAARGLGQSGENITANVGLQAARQNALANIGQRETTANAQLNQQIADLRRAGAGDLETAEAALAANRTRDIISELQRQDGRNLDIYKYLSSMGYQRDRDSVMDARDQRDFDYKAKMDELAIQMQQDQIKWSQNPDNPQVRGQIIANETAALKLLSLPQELELRLKQMEQDLQSGAISQEQARATIAKIYNDMASGSSASKSEASNEGKTYLYNDIDAADDPVAYVTENAAAIRADFGQSEYLSALRYAEKLRDDASAEQ